MSEESKKVNILRGQIEPQVVVKNVSCSHRSKQKRLSTGAPKAEA